MTTQDVDHFVTVAAEVVKGFIWMLLAGVFFGLIGISLRLFLDYSDGYIEALAKWMSGV